MKVNAITIGFRRRRRSRAVARFYPAVLDDGDTRFLNIASVISATKGITKDGSNLISKWADYRESGRDLLQATGTNQMLWSANGVLADGIDNFMKSIAFTWNQPEFIYIVFRQITWTLLDKVIDGNSDASMLLYQRLTTPNLQVYAGDVSAESGDLLLNTWGIARVLFDGANSKFIINNTTPITGNFGAVNAGGITIGALASGSTAYGNIEVKEIIGRSSAVGEAVIYAYLKTKYGL